MGSQFNIRIKKLENKSTRGNLWLSIFHIKKIEKGPSGAAMPRHLSSANESAVLMEPRFSVSLIK